MCAICIFLGVAFFTLLERKLLRYSQLRKGPNKTSFFGFLQPLSDAFKLILKRRKIPLNSNYILFFLSPFLRLLLMLLSWILYSSIATYYWIFYGFLFYLCVRTMAVYPLFSAGWSSNSKYSFIGAIRGACQIVSYEIRFIFMILTVLLFCFSYDVSFIKKFNWFLVLVSPIWFICWIALISAEVNRAPFDFAEGESELVSGFNTEYAGGGFAMIFLSEYGNIMFLCFMTSIFLVNNFFIFFLGFFTSLVLCCVIIFARSAYPRFRYDLLMNISWQVILFASFFFVTGIIIFSCINNL